MQAQLPALTPSPSLTAAHSWIPHILGWVTVEEGPAELTVAPSGVVLTPITHAPAYVPRCQVDSHVKVAAVSVPVALTLWREGKDQLGNQVPRIRDARRGASIITWWYHRLPRGGTLRTSRPFGSSSQSRLQGRVIKAWIPFRQKPRYLGLDQLAFGSTRTQPGESSMCRSLRQA